MKRIPNSVRFLGGSSLRIGNQSGFQDNPVQFLSGTDPITKPYMQKHENKYHQLQKLD